jgi:cystathionine gamma-synthase
MYKSGMELGQPIPNDAHAVSVSLPQWEDVKGYEEGVPSVINAMKLGYPRFVYHPLLKKLFAEAEKKFASAEEFCLVFPSDKVAKLCVKFCETGKVEKFADGIFAVILPKGLEKKAKEFWMHAGLIVSSRKAETILNNKQTAKGNGKEVVKEKLSSLTNADKGDIYLFPSGMGAIFTAYSLVNDKTTLQLGFPYVDTLKIQEKFGTAKFLNYKSATDLQALETELKTGKISAVITEFPLNPVLTCVELDEVSRLCRQYGAAFIVDDTLATWENVDVLQYADIAVTSLTKFFSGVGDVLAGSLILNKNSPLYSQLKSKLTAAYEDLLFDADAEVLAKNCADFEDRIESINQNAERFFEELKKLPNVRKVYYTKDDPVYKKYKKPGAGYGGIISVVFETEEQAREYFNNLDCKKGPSLGTNYTLACPYTMLAHYYERDFAESSGVPFHLIRFSVGVE